MLQTFVFNELAIVVRHWYEVAETDDEEHGARLELMRRIRQPHSGSESAAQAIGIDGLLWRVDLFDRIGDTPGSMRRAHHHYESVKGNEPVARDYDDDILSYPYGWTERRLADLPRFLAEVGVELEEPEEEAADVRRALPAIIAALRSFGPDLCDSPAKCLEATRDITDIVRMMTTQFRDSPEDPRLLGPTDSWPSA